MNVPVQVESRHKSRKSVAIAKAMTEILNNPDKAKEVSQEVREVAVQVVCHFAWKGNEPIETKLGTFVVSNLYPDTGVEEQS